MALLPLASTTAVSPVMSKILIWEGRNVVSQCRLRIAYLNYLNCGWVVSTVVTDLHPTSPKRLYTVSTTVSHTTSQETTGTTKLPAQSWNLNKRMLKLLCGVNFLRLYLGFSVGGNSINMRKFRGFYHLAYTSTHVRSIEIRPSRNLVNIYTKLLNVH